jgi:uncharacterized protein RhaS with RHS repeats
MSPDLGRFLQPDPIGFKGDASNLYRYCGNDWANRTDPMGLLENTRVDLDQHEKANAQRDNSPWSGIEKDQIRAQVNVDAHHAENMRNARAEVKEARAVESVPVSVTSEIGHGPFSGVKSVQQADLSSDGAVTPAHKQTGSTPLYVTSLQGRFSKCQEVSGKYPEYTVNMVGVASAYPLRKLQTGMTIRYDLDIKINFATHQASISGWHTAYPSFHVKVGGRQIYNYAERSLFDLRQNAPSVPAGGPPTGY